MSRAYETSECRSLDVYAKLMQIFCVLNVLSFSEIAIRSKLALTTRRTTENTANSIEDGRIESERRLAAVQPSWQREASSRRPFALLAAFRRLFSGCL